MTARCSPEQTCEKRVLTDWTQRIRKRPWETPPERDTCAPIEKFAPRIIIPRGDVPLESKTRCEMRISTGFVLFVLSAAFRWCCVATVFGGVPIFDENGTSLRQLFALIVSRPEVFAHRGKQSVRA